MTLDLQTALVAIAAGAVVLDRVLEMLGLSRSAKSLRRENEDLARYNGELEKTVERLEVKVDQQRAEIGSLRADVEKLAQRDQAAVLAAIETHEENAERRHERGESRHVETAELLRDIRDVFVVATTPQAGGASA